MVLGVFWNTLLLAWFFKNTFPHRSFENEIQTLQLDIKFSNPTKLVTNFEHGYIPIGIYITYILTNYKEIWRTLLIFRPIPSHPSIKLALRARGVNPALDPGGRCKGLVESSKGTWSENIKILLKFEKKMFKKGVVLGVFWNTLLLAWFFKNTFPHRSFENEIQTLQLDIKFSNPTKLVTNFEHGYIPIGIYITYILTNYKEIWRTLLIFRPIPSHPSIKLALRARGVNPALDPGGRCKGLVETSKGLCSLVWIVPQLPNLTSNFDKKGLWSFVVLKHLTFSMIFQKHICP